MTPESSGVPSNDTAVVIERIRASFEGWAEEWFDAEAAWDLLPVVGGATTPGTTFAIPPTSSLRLIDFDRVLHDGTGWQLWHNLDRLAVSFRWGPAELRVGRQALGFGSSRIMPAADIFAPFGPGTIDTEFKRGLDAIRLVSALGEYHAIEAIAVLRGTDWAEGMYLARWSGSFPEAVDLSVLAGASWGLPTIAIDLGGDVGGATWYLEASARIAPKSSEEPQVRVTVGIDTQPVESFRLVVELHGSSIGELYANDYVRMFGKEGVRHGEVYFVGPLYASLLGAWQVSPLHLLSLSAIQNLTDASLLLAPAWSNDFSSHATVNVGALLPIGPRPRGVGGVPIQPSSEFGSYPFVAYADVRLVF